jgi:membrane complex biogenesis BtpA family protein
VFERAPREPAWVVATVHLPPLPGSPGYGGAMGPIHERALRDARALAAAGADAVIVENFGDAPFFPDRVPPVTVAAIAMLAGEVRQAIDLPVGVNVLRNDGAAALGIAAAAELAFIRVNVLAGARVTDQGLVLGQAHELVRTRRALGLEKVAILADVQVKHSAPLGPRPIGEEAAELAERAGADAVLVTGVATGRAPAPAEIAEVRKSVSVPVLVASGVDPQSAELLLENADGCIVGSALKHDGKAANEVDFLRAREVIAALKALW